MSGDPAGRSVDAARICAWLLLGGWIFEARAGEHGRPEADVAAALDRWVALGLPANGQKFDPAEVQNFGKRAALDGRDDFWPRRFTRTCRRLVQSHHGGAAERVPPPPGRLPPRHFRVALRRTFYLGDTPPGAPLRLRLPLPLEDACLRELSVRPLSPVGAALSLTLAPGRLEARGVADGAATLAIGAECAFTALPAPAAPSDLSAEDRHLYTRPAEGLIQVTSRVRALAQSLAEGTASPLEAVRAFWAHLLGRLNCGAVHYHALQDTPATDWVLHNGWYDCQLGSALLVALCRAHGIPARLVGGNALYQAAPFPHFWAEIFFPDSGWAPFDLLCWDLSLGGRDPAWRDYFFGRLDYRMKTQILPRSFTGPMSLRLPPRWHVLAEAEGDGIVTHFTEFSTGRPIFSDSIAAAPADQSANAAPL